MLFKPNYLKPGKGLPEERDPNQSRLSIFFEILGEKFWDLIKLNLLYVLFSIPAFIVTCIVMGFPSTASLNPMLEAGILAEDAVYSNYWSLNILFAICFNALWGLGPSTAGLTYALRNIGREEHVWLFSDFWQKIKENFKQSFCLWVLDLVLFFLIIFAYNFYGNMAGVTSYLRYILIFFVLVYTLLHLFVYQLMITFKLPLKAIMRNALILSLAKAPKSVLLLIINVLIHIILPLMATLYISPISIIIYVILEIVFLPVLSSFITNFAIYPTIEEYIKIAEENK